MTQLVGNLGRGFLLFAYIIVSLFVFAAYINDVLQAAHVAIWLIMTYMVGGYMKKD